MTQEDLKQELHKMNENTSLKQLQEYEKQMVETRGFAQETSSEIMLLLTEEIGELAKEVRKISNMKLDTTKQREYHMEEEVADVFNYLMAICRVNQIDLLEAFKKKEEINCNRTWK